MIEKGGEVAEKGGTPEMEVAGFDVCVSVCSKNHTSQIKNTKTESEKFSSVRLICNRAKEITACRNGRSEGGLRMVVTRSLT